MTINSTQNRVSYAGNSVTVAFAFPYRFLANADLIVLLTTAAGVTTTLALGSDYSVTGATLSGGGTVTTTVAPATGTSLVIYRDPAATQLTHWVDNDPLPASSIENATDKLTMIVQRVKDVLARSFRLSDADTSGASTALPTPKANQLIGWDPTGLNLTNIDASTVASIAVSGGFIVDTFSGTGAQTAFPLSQAPGGVNNTQLYISGVYQSKSQYGLSGSTLTFNSAPPAGVNNIQVVYFATLVVNTVLASNALFTPVGNLSSTDVQSALAELDNEKVGLVGNQTISGTKTFSTRPIVGTATAGTSDTGAASTAFVAGATANPIGRLINTIYNSVVAQTVTLSIASPCLVTYAATTSSPRNNAPIVLSSTGALPTGLVAGTTYYATNSAGGFSNLSLTPGGASINTTGSQSGTQTVANPGYLKATNNPSSIIVEAWGGGGGSGYAGGAAFQGVGGGGAGGFARQKILSANILTSEIVTVGAGGAAGNGAAGGTGGTSSFGSHSSATGGVGSPATPAGSNFSGAGANGGTGVGGDLNLTGAAGTAGVSAGSALTTGGGTGGASSLGGTTAALASVQGAGTNAANNSASGASGGIAASSAQLGGVGGSGLVIIYEYA